MKHADQIIERILFLEGLPNVQDMNKVMIGEEPVECLNCDLKLEEKALADLKNAIVDSEKLQDFVSRDLFRSILDSEEEHVDVIETHLGLVDKVGKENWLQSQGVSLLHTILSRDDGPSNTGSSFCA